MSPEADIIVAHLQEENAQRNNFFEYNREILIECAFKVALCFAKGNKILATAKGPDFFLAQNFVSLLLNNHYFPPLPAITLEISSSAPEETQATELLNKLEVLADFNDILLIYNTSEFSDILLAVIRQALLKNNTIIIFGINSIMDLPNRKNLLFLFNPNISCLNKSDNARDNTRKYSCELQTQELFLTASLILSKLIYYFLFENPERILKALVDL